MADRMASLGVKIDPDNIGSGTCSAQVSTHGAKLGQMRS
jgi:hypothetical protein